MADDNQGEAGTPGRRHASAEALSLSGASREKSDAYLDAQIKLTQLQSQNLVEQNAFELSHLRWQQLNDRLRGVLQMLIVIVVVAILAGVCLVLWYAAHADGLVIEAFSVPPDFARKGLTGDVVAAKVLDRLSMFQSETSSNRAPSSYANNWGDNIKVQIPDTGVSIGELNRLLHQWLGHETYISGEVYRTATGIAVTARVAGKSSPTFAGSDGDLDKLIEQAAETVYRATQPYRYAVYLSEHNRAAESRAEYQRLIASGPPLERGWAYIGLANDVQLQGKIAQAIADLHRAIAERPDLLLAYVNLFNYESNLAHDDAAFDALQEFVAHAKSGDASMGKDDLKYNLLVAKQGVAAALGDYREALSAAREALNDPNRNGSHENAQVAIVQICAAMHDARCVHRTYASLSPTTNAQILVNRIGTLQLADISLHDWHGILALRGRETALLKSLGPIGALFIRELEQPSAGLAEAELGHFSAADALLADCPADSDLCMRTRGQLRAAEGKWSAANYWFARASRDAAHTPFGYQAWGEALLTRGDADGAVVQFKKANSVAPHFADPLEGWGEALIAKNRSDLALVKFAEADKYAPNWGRLHLKWGEALLWSGDKNSAKEQFAIASGLDLTRSEKSELERMNKTHG